MQIVDRLRQENVSRLDLSHFASCAADRAVADVLKLMRTEKISAVFIVENDKLLGVFTERDVLTKIADAPDTWRRPVAEFMTPSPQVIGSDRPISEALRLMNDGHYRNLPITDADGRVTGNLPHIEVIRFLADQFPREVYNLPPDPDRVATTKEGA